MKGSLTFAAYPTTKTVPASGHEASSSETNRLGLGVASVVHELPFQCNPLP